MQGESRILTQGIHVHKYIENSLVPLKKESEIAQPLEKNQWIAAFALRKSEFGFSEFMIQNNSEVMFVCQSKPTALVCKSFTVAKSLLLSFRTLSP